VIRRAEIRPIGADASQKNLRIVDGLGDPALVDYGLQHPARRR
jgi:hypothetical protein